MRALLLQALYTIRSERQLMEQLDYNLLFRWFVGLGMDDRGVVGDHLLEESRSLARRRHRGGVLRGGAAPRRQRAAALAMSTSPWMGRCWRPGPVRRVFGRATRTPPAGGGSNPTVDFRGDARRNTTHQSTTDPDARLYKKSGGGESRLSYLGHVLLEHRSGLIVQATVTPADGHGERDAALTMIERLRGPAPPHRGGRQGLRHARLRGGAAHDGRDAACGAVPATVHRRSAIDRRTTRHAGYAVSQRKRKLVEQSFGWMKTVGGLRKLRHRGGPLVTWVFTFAAAAYNIVRMRRLLPATA